MPRQKSFIDGERIRKARTLRHVEPIQEHLATALAAISELRYVKLFPGRLTASNQLSADGKKNPVVTVGGEGVTGVELLIDANARVVQFYAITSAEKGAGRKMVEAVVGATPTDWFLAVPFDWSGGFWERMARDYPRLQVA
ncbi:MAG: hypothetical protein WBM40_15020 [Thiohalocapsa sp.]